MHSVWCFAHRLNLVTKSFLTTKPVNVVLEFTDWFSSRREQVSYKRFLEVKHPNVRLRVIPQPSETRWLFFYRDAVSAIMSQQTYVESFVTSELDFFALWNRMRNDTVKYGESIDQIFSLQSPFIKAAFSFTSEILDILGRVNTVFQQRFCTVSKLWDIILSLKSKISLLVEQSGGHCSTCFECLCGLSSVET